VVEGFLSALVERIPAGPIREEIGKSLEERLADRITRFTGSIPFVYLHAVIFGTWILVNARLIPGLPAFDPFPFVMLAMTASVEAIFLATFVLISQNRMAALSDKRADLDLQVSLLAEHELTRLIALVDAVAQRVGVHVTEELGIEHLKKDVPATSVLREIETLEEREKAG
jgi:uncharacterized membrane protein